MKRKRKAAESSDLDARIEAELASFGKQSFRPGQREVVEQILSGARVSLSLGSRPRG